MDFEGMYDVDPSGLEEILEACVKDKKPLIITSSPGIGKTSIVSQIARKIEIDFVPMYPSNASETDFVGMPIYDREDKKASFLPFDQLDILISAEKPTLVLLDDFGQARPSIQAACMHLLSERRVGYRPLSDNVVFVIATNDRGQNAGVNGILEPVKSRAVSIVKLAPNLDDWVKYAMANDLREEVIAFMKFKPELLNDFNPTSELINSPSPRNNEHVSDILNMNLKPKLRNAMIAGAVGVGYASEFAPFLDLYENMIPPSAILKNPEGVELHEERPDLMNAYCTALARMATRDNLGQIIKFCNRIPPEYGFKMMEYDIHAKGSLKETSAYIEWANNNQDMFKLN